jgi:hypothetical protein
VCVCVCVCVCACGCAPADINGGSRPLKSTDDKRYANMSEEKLKKQKLQSRDPILDGSLLYACLCVFMHVCVCASHPYVTGVHFVLACGGSRKVVRVATTFGSSFYSACTPP